MEGRRRAGIRKEDWIRSTRIYLSNLMLCKQFHRLSFKKHRGYEIEKEGILLAYQVN